MIDAGFPGQYDERGQSARGACIHGSSILSSIAPTRLLAKRSAVAARETSVGNMTKVLNVAFRGGNSDRREDNFEEVEVEQSRITSGRRRLRKSCVDN